MSPSKMFAVGLFFLKGRKSAYKNYRFYPCSQNRKYDLDKTIVHCQVNTFQKTRKFATFIMAKL